MTRSLRVNFEQWHSFHRSSAAAALFSTADENLGSLAANYFSQRVQAKRQAVFQPPLGGQGGGSDRNLAPNIERNSNYGDANYRLDLRVARDIRLTENFTLELIGESFNLFNRSNFNGFNSTRYDAQATTVATPLATPIALVERANFGVENNNSSQPDGTNARRFQLAARFRF